MPIFYFAYGSNMSLPRLAARIPVQAYLGAARLPGHELRFHKVGSDGSGKCDAWYSGEGVLYGVLYQLEIQHKAVLDQIEGLGAGYDEKTVAVHNRDTVIEAVTYVATAIDRQLQPLCWYHRHVLHGAEQAGLPDEHLVSIRSVAIRTDHDQQRATRELAIYAD